MPEPRSRVKWTYDDFLLFPDDGKRHELIDGEHYVTPSPVTRHQRIVAALYLRIATVLQKKPLGEIFLSPLDVVLSDVDVVEPDLLYIAAERSEIVTEKNVRGAPDLVIEVLSQGTRRRDLGIKLSLYEKSGVREYWLVDPEAERVELLRLGPEGYGSPTILSASAGDEITSPLLPGLEIPVRALFD